MSRKTRRQGFRVFVRNWWKRNPRWPGGLEPAPGARKHTISYQPDEESARLVARQYNATHDPGPLSRKAEYEEARTRHRRR